MSKAADVQQFADEISGAFSALSKMSMTSEIDNQRTIKDILKRCPLFIRHKWQQRALNSKREKDKYPDFANFVEFMKKMASDCSDPEYGVDMIKDSSVKQFSMSGANFNAVAQVPMFAADESGSRPQAASATNLACVCCNKEHRLFACETFKAMQVKDRLNMVKQFKLCFNCLKAGHRAYKCRKMSVCSVPGCGMKHSRFIHTDPVSPSSVINPAHVDNERVGSADMAAGTTMGQTSSVKTHVISGMNAVGGDAVQLKGSEVYLPMVPLIVNGKLVVNALLDSGSTNTFISESLASTLQLPGKVTSFNLSTLSQKGVKNWKAVSMHLSPVGGGDPVRVDNVLVTPGIPTRCPNLVVDTEKYPHLLGVPLKSAGQCDNADLLIGMDNAHLLMPLEIRRNDKFVNEPYAVRSYFGWSLHGYSAGCSGEVFVNFVSLEKQVENLWRFDAEDSFENVMSIQDQKVLRFWDNEISHDKGHYTLPIPWRDGRPNLPNNRYMATCRLESLTRKLQRTGMVDKYSDSITQMLQKGHAERVPIGELALNDGSVWYLPHHAVTSAAKPNKVRVVFDCAAKQSGKSLNNQCLQGPDLNNKLISVLLRFRQYQYALMADVEAMYLQVRIPHPDRNALRFLWFLDGVLTEFRMTSHLFGGVWCASSSTYAMRCTVNDTSASGIVADTINRAFYVDDMLVSVKSKTEATEVIKGTKETLCFGGFNLTKFVINDQELLGEIEQSDRAAEVKELTPDVLSKALGIQWNVDRDTFFYVSRPVVVQAAVSRRIALSQVASMYDPLGLISPIVLEGRRIFQEATRLKLSWDEPLPHDVAQRWFAWLTSLSYLPEIHFQRCIIPAGFADAVAELHHFCDGSQVGFGACSYIRLVSPSGKIHVALVTAKSRLAPLKQVSIPRLELSAAVLSVELDTLLRRELDVHLIGSTFWTDSEIVRSYIHNESKRYKVFVANRISLIRQHSEPAQWLHVDGTQNPADVVSRGCNADNLPLSWFSGPPFLGLFKSEWPMACQSDLKIPEDDPEVCSSQMLSSRCCMASVVPSSHPLELLCGYYSSYYRLKKAVCWLLRLKSRLMKRTPPTGPITVAEMSAAEKMVLNHVQCQMFGAELTSLRSCGRVHRSSPIFKLCPQMFDGLLVVGGRLKHASILSGIKNPIILPRDHHVSRMIVQEYHENTHLGVEWVLSRIRCKFWIVNARNMVKRVKRACVTCKRLYAAPMNQKMADLPPERCLPNVRPFSYTGLDFFGPFYVKIGRSQVKRYGCVFTCFSTRAIHLEMAVSLDTDAFINAFIRFVSRRGAPQKVWSINGTNLVGGHAELKRCLQ